MLKLSTKLSCIQTGVQIAGRSSPLASHECLESVGFPSRWARLVLANPPPPPPTPYSPSPPPFFMSCASPLNSNDLQASTHLIARRDFYGMRAARELSRAFI